MEPLGVKRRLTCILAADAVGYSKMMGEDEVGTVRVLSAHRAVIDGIIAFHNGRIVGTAGDSVLAEFGSAVEAVRCAVEIQEALKTRNEALPEDHRLQFRVGVNLGDVVVKGEDLLGDGVNVAARLESIAEPGGVCIASSVYDQITGKLDLGFVDIGEQNLKNISRPIRVYRVAGAGVPMRRAPAKTGASGKGPMWAAASVVAVIVTALAIAWQVGWLSVGAPRAPAEHAKMQATSEDLQRQTVAVEQAQHQTQDAAGDVKRNAEIEAELTRVRAEADAAAVRAKAEAVAARAKAEADTLLAKAQAVAAATRAQSEADKIRNAAEADKAKAEQGQREAEAKVAEMTARPAASSTSPASPVPSTLSRGAQPRAGQYDGAWMVGRACEAFEELPTLSDRWRVTVQAGEFDIERGGRGQPGYWHITGKPADDGTLVLAGIGISRNQKHAGRQVQARFEGRLAEDRFVLQGNFGGRACTLTLARAGG
jgi:class 3 adenylate cyclase